VFEALHAEKNYGEEVEGVAMGKSFKIATIGGILAGALTYPFTASVGTLLYVDMRMRKEGLDIELMRQRVETLDPDFFEALSENDFLFIDSSHVIRPQGDVLYEFQRILPRLKKGVIAHFHDIYTPMDYPERWIVDEVKFWNEQYLLEVFLAGNRDGWNVLLASFFLSKTRFIEFQQACPLLSAESEPGSFYIRKAV